MGNTQGYKDFADLSDRIHSKACHTLLRHIKEHRDAMIEQLQLSPRFGFVLWWVEWGSFLCETHQFGILTKTQTFGKTHVLFLRKEGSQSSKNLGHQIPLTKQHFDDLSVDEWETYGLNFS